MSKKPAALPHIEDATFAACLAPLAGSLVAGAGNGASGNGASGNGASGNGADGNGADGEEHAPAVGQRVPPGVAEFADQASTQPWHATGTAGAAHLQPGATASRSTRQALAAWRSLADQEFAEFCAIDQFLAKSDAELAAAVLHYPRQVRGFLARLMRIEHRRTAQQQTMTDLIARIEMALIQVETDPTRELTGKMAWGVLPYPKLR